MNADTNKERVLIHYECNHPCVKKRKILEVPNIVTKLFPNDILNGNFPNNNMGSRVHTYTSTN